MKHKNVPLILFFSLVLVSQDVLTNRLPTKICECFALPHKNQLSCVCIMSEASALILLSLLYPDVLQAFHSCLSGGLFPTGFGRQTFPRGSVKVRITFGKLPPPRTTQMRHRRERQLRFKDRFFYVGVEDV